MNEERRPLSRFLAPRFWLLWLGFAVMRAVVLLPYSLQVRVGHGFGRLAYAAFPRRRRIAARNIELCFPDMSPADREALLRRHFLALGMSMVETSLCWWGTDAKILPLVTVRGMEHLEAALAGGHGAIMLTGHFTALDLGGRFVAMKVPVHAMYRPHRNPLFDEIQKRGRERSAEKAISKRDIRALIRGLREHRAIWYAPDQSYRRKQGVVLPFFGVPAPTNTATSSLARVSKAPVLPFYPRRRPDNRGYDLVILPPLDDFPGKDRESDARRINALLEEWIREAPEQYLWVHRRFKMRDPAYEDVYEGI